MASSHITSHSYDANAKRMTVTFTNGQAYTYENVPQAVATGMEKAVSKGSYFHRMLKNRPDVYRSTKVSK